MPKDPQPQRPPERTEPAPALARAAKARRPGKLGLRVLDGPEAQVELSRGPTLRFGRSPNADVVLAHPSVSKLHFSLRVGEQGVELEDLGSSNGTWFAGRRVRRVTLQPGDGFRAGRCSVELVNVREIEVEVSTRRWLGSLYGDCVLMRELFATLEKLAPTPLDMLIQGETGTGKELTARTIHELSRRAEAPFVVLDCSTLASTLADATIFGFRRGAFTGAEYDQPGMFEQADGGTLFIDEIGELSPSLQMKFLRALDRREVTRLGEPGRVRRVDVRVVAATNRDLSAEVRAGRFREDLYHRVGHARVRLPALRERGLDALRLAEHFLDQLDPDDRPAPALADDAKTVLAGYEWPGNVRELESAVRRAAFVCRDGVIHAEDLQLGRESGWLHEVARAVDGARLHSYEALHELVDRVWLPGVLERRRTITAASAELGITRARLRSRLQKLGLYDSDDS